MKKLLIVVDYQKDFVTGSLGSGYAAAIEPALCEKIKQYRAAGEEIVFTFDTHHENYLDTQEGRMLPLPHCIQGEAGWQLTDPVEALRTAEDRCFYKGCFGSGELFAFLQGRAYAQIELVGVVTNICVISNAILAKTAQPETPIVVDAACTASNDPTLHEKALDLLESMQTLIINR